MEITKTRTPLLWRTRDPEKLKSMGQLELPGLGIADSRTDDQAWLELESASSRGTRRHAPLGTWPAAKLTGRAGRDWRFEHEDG